MSTTSATVDLATTKSADTTMKTALCHMLGIEYPIVAALMGPDLTGPEMVAEVTTRAASVSCMGDPTLVRAACPCRRGEGLPSSRIRIGRTTSGGGRRGRHHRTGSRGGWPCGRRGLDVSPGSAGMD